MVNHHAPSPTAPNTESVDVVRFSFLVRNPALDHAAFLDHYEKIHGPLAVEQAGFRKYTIEYVQNHCIDKIAGDTWDIDGVTATTQLPRTDYGVGFFQEPDYAKVQVDERYLFDLGQVRSVLARRHPTQGEGGSYKHFALTRGDAHTRLIEAIAPRRRRTSVLDTSTSSALGFGSADFDFDVVTELWTDEPVSTLPGHIDAHLWRMRELVMIPLDSSDPTEKEER